jgi:hypothetical protein
MYLFNLSSNNANERWHGKTFFENTTRREAKCVKTVGGDDAANRKTEDKMFCS